MMPYGTGEYRRDLAGNLAGNQGGPLLLSNKGRSIWSEDPYAFAFKRRTLELTSVTGPVELNEGQRTLREAFCYASRQYFPPTGEHPDSLLFRAPQYNTWIEMSYELNQERVLAYAEAILAHGMEPGVLFIDDNWQDDYGSWVFHPGRFPDPHAMIAQLHQLGFKVVLWVCPFISPDSATFRLLSQRGYCLRAVDGAPAIRSWWNGHSALLDCTNDEAVAWLCEQLDGLVAEFGVDGFKFDAGDPEYYRATDLSYRPMEPNDHCACWAQIGLRYPLSEYRACWKLAGKALAQRLKDKYHTWDNEGLATLIPNGLAQGLLGYAFTCPDMIGGGDIISINDRTKIDQELIVRSAQCSALFPMMQFSLAPWRVLDGEHLGYCVEAAQLHTRMGDEIMRWVRHAAQTGEPIIRHMAYMFPEQGYELVKDQFMLGEHMLVAPVVKRGATSRTIMFPAGSWLGDDGSVVAGPCVKEVAAPLSRLPWYVRETHADAYI